MEVSVMSSKAMETNMCVGVCGCVCVGVGVCCCGCLESQPVSECSNWQDSPLLYEIQQR